MELILLTHSRELQKASNTGRLISETFSNVRIIIWQRTEPDQYLLSLISSGETALIYPGENSYSSESLIQYKHFILIDSTWQEARKIYNRSPYLHNLPCIELSTEKASRYNLRRNQLENGLCTAECAIELFKQTNCSKEADLLEQKFLLFTGNSNV